jgi:hypothetical protein
VLIPGLAVFPQQVVLDRVRLREKSDRQRGDQSKLEEAKRAGRNSRQTPLIATGPRPGAYWLGGQRAAGPCAKD